MSGMSPVAADLASAESAPADPFEPVEPADDDEPWLVDPHPATASAAAASVAIPAFAGDMAPSLLERDDSFLKGWSPS